MPLTVLSRKYRCVWIRITKNASTSILAALLATDPDCVMLRVERGELYERYPEALDWFTFAFLRHPFSRALSFWSDVHYARWDPAPLPTKLEKRARKLERCYGLAETVDFDAYCAWLHTPYGADAYTDVHVMSQSVWISAAAEARGRPPDFIGRVEQLDADWAKVVGEIGLPCPHLPVLHSLAGWERSRGDLDTGRAARSLHLTEHNKALLASRYADDLALGGYAPTGLEVVGPVAPPVEPRAC